MLRVGEPLSSLEFVLLPLYMHHRFQLTAAVQSLGGADYRYALRGDGQTPVTIVDAEEQRDALETVLSTLTVDFLALPEGIVQMIPPPAYRHGDGETFEGYTGLLFDPVGAAEAAASFTLRNLLHPMRLARILVYGSMGDYPDPGEVIDRMLEVTWGASAPADAYRTRVLHAIQRVTVDEMMTQASREGTQAEVRAILAHRLGILADQLEAIGEQSPHERLVLADIRRWERRMENTIPGPPLQIPAGDPIGN